MQHSTTFSIHLNHFQCSQTLLLLDSLNEHGIHIQQTICSQCMIGAKYYEEITASAIVVITSSEKEIMQTFELLNKYNLDEKPVSVKNNVCRCVRNAGTHILISWVCMAKKHTTDDITSAELRCVNELIPRYRQVILHGDFTALAGGDFLMAWNILLGRHGRSCPSIVGGRIILWDGTPVAVSEKDHRGLLDATRSDDVAKMEVATQTRLRLEGEPRQVAWKCTFLTKAQLYNVCVAYQVLGKAVNLPYEISVYFRFYFEPGQMAPTCSLTVLSLLSAEATIQYLYRTLGREITSLMSEVSDWNERPLAGGLRLASRMATEPQISCDEGRCQTSQSLMSKWVGTRDTILQSLYAAFESVQNHPNHKHMSVLIAVGGGRVLESYTKPRGNIIAVFKQQRDITGKDRRSQELTLKIWNIFQAYEDIHVSTKS